MQGTSRDRRSPSWGRGIWGQLFWSLLRRAYRAPVSRLRELKDEPTPESLTCYINHLCIPVPGQNKVSHVVITTDVMDSPIGRLGARAESTVFRQLRRMNLTDRF
jgi:hypothetical protein